MRYTESWLSTEEVATKKGVKPATVVGYLIDAHATGLTLDLDRRPQLSPVCVATVRAATAAVADAGGDVHSVKQVRERLVVVAEMPTYIEVRIQIARDRC